MAAPEWKVIADFSPGIISNISPNHPDGAANPDGTFRCYSIQGGSLAPLPRLTHVIKPPIPGSGSLVVGDSLPLASTLKNEEHRIIGLHVNGPLYNVDHTIVGPEQDNSEIFVVFDSWTERPGINDRENIRTYRYRRSWTDPQWELIDDHQLEIEPFNANKVPPWADIANSRSNSANRDRAGPIITGVVSYGRAFFFPNDTSTSTNSTANMPANYGDALLGSTLGAINLVAHQGRMVIFPLLIEGGGDDAFWVTNEAMLWTLVNNAKQREAGVGPDGGDPGYFNVLVGWENPSGYHVMQSLSYDELLLIKSRGGGQVIRGDLQNFVAETFPYVRSTGYTNNRGTNTPLGFVYPVDGSGAWLWTGGQVSQFITPHLDDDFWRVPLIAEGRQDSGQSGYEMNFLHYPSACAQWGDFIMFPNNWVWDVSVESQDVKSVWWRIANPDAGDDEGDGYTIVRWSSDWRQTRCYGTPTGVYDPDNTCLYEFDRQAPANQSYRWLSHPMSETLEREIHMTEGCVVASGKGEITVRAFTASDPNGMTREFQVDGTPSRPTIVSLGYEVRGPQLTFDIRSRATDPLNGEAPTLHEWRYAVSPDKRLIGD